MITELRRKYTLPASGIILILMLISCSEKQNWPQFRGPESNMLFSSKNLPEEWGDNINVLWTNDLEGTGYSSPVIWGKNVIISLAVPVRVNPVPERGPNQGPPPQGGQNPRPGQAPQPGQGQQPPQGIQQPEVRDTSFKSEIYRLEVICYDLNNGKEIWKQVAYEGAPREGKNPNSTYACETPATDGKRIFAFFGMNGLYCYDMEGNLLWKKELGPYYTQRGWGTGSSPLLFNDVLYIQFDNEENSSLKAFDATTGNEKWSVSRDEKTTYSTPYIWKNKVRTELVTCGKKARSYDPETGTLLWEVNVGGEQVIPSPVGNEDLLFLGNPGGRQLKPVLIAVKTGGNGQLSDSDLAWRTEDSGLGNPSPLLYNGLLYIIGSRGEIAVLDPSSGKVKYQKRINGIGACWASPWAFKNKVYFIDERGVTRSFNADAEFNMISENILEGSKFWSSVAVAGDNYIIKGGEKIYCIGK